MESRIENNSLKLPDCAITVVIPHFKCEEFLESCVSSLLDQTFRDFAIVIVDDCSPIDRFRSAVGFTGKYRNIYCFRSDRNVGPYRLKNAVLPFIRSRWVAFQDADDLSDRFRFAKQVDFMMKTSALIVGSGFRLIDASGRFIREKIFVKDVNLWTFLGRRFTQLHPTTLIQTTGLQRLGGFDGTARFAADQEFLLRAVRLGAVRNIAEPLYYYRYRPDSLSNSATTGLGSVARAQYVSEMKKRFKIGDVLFRRSADDKLIAIPNDVHVNLTPVWAESSKDPPNKFL